MRDRLRAEPLHPFRNFLLTVADVCRAGGKEVSARLLAGRGAVLAATPLVHFAHWVTPPSDTRRFDTRFFATRVPPHQTPAHDETETTHSAWVTAAGAIAKAQANEIVLPLTLISPAPVPMLPIVS